MSRLFLPLAIGATLFVSICSPVQAQWNAYDAMMSNNSYSRGWVNPYNNTMSNIYQSNMNLITTQAINRQMNYSIINSSMGLRGRQGRFKTFTKRQQTDAEKFAKYGGTMYKPAASKAPAKVAALFAKNTGGKASDFQPVMVELLKLYQTQAKQQNAPSTDLARTLAYCISANYYYYTGGTGVPETQVAELRKKLRVSLLADPKFRAMSNAQKQELNESMVILTHFAALGFEVVAKKVGPDKSQQVREGYKKLAGVNLQGLLGVDPSRVSFDKSGLVIKAA